MSQPRPNRRRPVRVVIVTFAFAVGSGLWCTGIATTGAAGIAVAKAVALAGDAAASGWALVKGAADVTSLVTAIGAWCRWVRGKKGEQGV
jgi:hypothetical protein